MGREERQKKVSTARRRAEEHSTGYQTTRFNIPEGLRFFEMRPGTIKIDVLPYLVKTGKETKGGNPFAEKGELHWERTFYQYKKIGPDEKSYIAPGKTFGEPDFIQEYVNKQSKKKDADVEFLDSLKAKERQLFLVYEPDDPDKGVQLLDFSYHMFGKLLDSRIQNSTEEEGWDLFYFPDMDGFTLRLTVVESSYGLDVQAIDFIPRKKDLPDKIANHGFDLDAILVKMDYEKLRDIFLGAVPDSAKEDYVSSKEEEKKETVVRKEEQESKKEKTKEVEPEKKKKPTTAEEAGLNTGDSVKYKGRVCSIAKISGDGTSLTLMAEDDDEIFRAIGCDEVVKEKKEEKKETTVTKEEPKKEKAKEVEVKKSEDTEDEWDKDWEN